MSRVLGNINLPTLKNHSGKRLRSRYSKNGSRTVSERQTKPFERNGSRTKTEVFTPSPEIVLEKNNILGMQWEPNQVYVCYFPV